MWQGVKTAVVVCVVTLLIWLWAEAESLTTATVTPRIELEATPDLFARFDERGWTGAVRVRLRGSTLAIDRAQRALAAPVRVSPGSVGLSAEPGTRAVDLADLLRSDASFAQLGVTIDEVDPPTARVAIEPLVLREIPVRLEAGAIEIEGEPVIDPATVSVRLTAADAGRLEPPSAATLANAVIEPADVVRLPEGESGTVRVRVSPPRALLGVQGVSIEPAQVSVTLKPRSRELTWLVPEASVAVVLPAGEVGRWSVEPLDSAVMDVRITGPRQMILDLQRRNDTPQALVVLTREDLIARVGSKPVTFAPIPGVLRFEGPGGSAVVRLRITPR